MTDYVHEHFSGNPGPVRKRLYCADGFNLSVQASRGHYCSPREDHAERYSTVEVGFPLTASGKTARPRCLGPTDDGVWGFVPVDTVNALIARHGGRANFSIKRT